VLSLENTAVSKLTQSPAASGLAAQDWPLFLQSSNSFAAHRRLAVDLIKQQK